MGAAVVLDADVLHRASVRDVLLRVARRGLFLPLWTADILDELARSLAGRGYTRDQTDRLTSAMNETFPQSLVTGHRRYIGRFTLPDADDRHVVAAAVKAKCGRITTFNLGDFPKTALAPHGIKAIHPDALLTALIGIDQASVLDAIDDLLFQLKNPPIPFARLIQGLKAQGLADFCKALETARGTR